MNRKNKRSAYHGRNHPDRSRNCRRSSRRPRRQPPKYVQKLDQQGRAYATGKRKDAVARVWIKPGSGKIMINEQDGRDLFRAAGAAHDHPAAARRRQPPGPVRRDLHGFRRRALGPGRRRAPRHLQGADLHEPDLRTVLKHGGFLTRDPRVVERKKYGKAKARRSFQFSKR